MGGSEAPICFDEEDVLSMLADFLAKFDNVVIVANRVAGLGRLSAGAKMAMKPFVKRVFTIFEFNSVKYAIYTM